MQAIDPENPFTPQFVIEAALALRQWGYQVVPIMPPSKPRRRVGRPARRTEQYYETLLGLTAAVIIRNPRAPLKAVLVIVARGFPGVNGKTVERDLFRALKTMKLGWKDFRAVMLRPINADAPAD